MKKLLYTFLAISVSLLAQGCNEESSSTAPTPEPESSESTTLSSAGPVIESSASEDLPNYSRAIAVNKMLGHGINFGNSWESGVDIAKPCKEGQETNWCFIEGKVYDYLDENWSNPIDDKWFEVAKAAGFQSIRMPVRWNQTALHEPPYTLQAERVEGVKRHVKIANGLGMPVIINQHHFNELYDNPEKYMAAFYGIWENVAEEFKDFDNDSLIFEVLNESRGLSDKYLAQMTDSAIKIIRKSNPGRTIMIDPGNWGKFEMMDAFVDIKDSNIIIDGHYYEPYNYSHQGHNTDCAKGVLWNPNDQQALLKIVSDLKSYVDMAKRLFPGKDGTHIPLNIGEFGASSRCDAEGQDDANRSLYIKAIVQTANQLGYSWHIWGFTGVGFDIYNAGSGEWYPEILKVLQSNMQ